MKSDKKYIVILLTTTLISVVTMIFFVDVENYLQYKYFSVDKDSYFIKNDNTNTEGILDDNIVQDIENKTKDTLIKEGNTVEEFVDDFADSADDNVDNTYKEKLEDIIEEKNDIVEEKDNIYTNNDSSNIPILEEERSITVFKMDKNNIVSNISNKDKLKLLKMANSLSINDYKELLAHIKRNDELLAAMDIFELLKEKLSANDYKKLTDILLPYVDIDIIENKINERVRK